MNLNLNAAIDAEKVCRDAFAVALATYGQGYCGAPRLLGGQLESVNCWWFAVGGGTSSRGAPNAPVAALDMDARIEGVFSERPRAWEFAFATIEALPIRGGNVQTLYLNGNPSNEYEYFALAGREGKHGLWRVHVPMRIVFNCVKGVRVS